MATKLLRYLKLYGHLIKVSAMMETEYRFSFFLEVWVEVAFFIATIAGFTVIFANVTEVAGWDRPSMLVLYGVNMIFSETILGIAFIFNLRELPHRIITGDLDMMLVKPVNSLFAATLWRPYFASVPSALAGLVAVVIGFKLGDMPFNPIHLIPFGCLFICGGVIAYSLGTIISSLSFWFLNSEPLPFLAQQFIFMARQPFDIYSGLWRAVFLIFIPTAIMVTYPVASLLGKFEWWWLGLGIILAAVFLYLASRVWQQGLQRYESASV